jgi:hypothetical protein
MSFSLIVGIYGAIVATIVAVIQLLGYRRDRRKVLIRISGGYEVHPPNPIYKADSYICITVSNSGRRPVTITKVGMLYPRKSSARAGLSSDSMMKGPREISEGQFLSDLIDEKDVGFPPEKYVAFAYDATGQVYWSHSVFKRLLKLGRIG